MIVTKCDSCKKRAFFPRQRTYNFDFLPNMGKTTSEDRLCGTCFKRVVFAIRKTHGKLKPPLWFIIKFYIMKAILHPKLLIKQIYDATRTKNKERSRNNEDIKD